MNGVVLSKSIVSLHLFAGGGGGILADMLLGRDIVGAVECEEYARKILLCRQADGILPYFPIWDDVKTFRADNPECTEYIEGLRRIRSRLCIAGGFPCQDLSIAGKGAGLEGERSGLWYEMQRIIGEIQPRYIFTEMKKEHDATTTTEEEEQRTLSDYLRLLYMNHSKCIVDVENLGR